jgi:hypothetical protein
VIFGDRQPCAEQLASSRKGWNRLLAAGHSIENPRVGIRCEAVIMGYCLITIDQP